MMDTCDDFNILNMIFMAMQVHKESKTKGCSRGQIISFLRGRVDAMRHRWDRSLSLKVIKILEACTSEKVFKCQSGRYFINDPGGAAGPIIAGEESNLRRSLEKHRAKNNFRKRIKRILIHRRIKKILQAKNQRQRTPLCTPKRPKSVSPRLKSPKTRRRSLPRAKEKKNINPEFDDEYKTESSPGLKSLIELQRKVDRERWRERSVACGCEMPETNCH